MLFAMEEVEKVPKYKKHLRAILLRHQDVPRYVRWEPVYSQCLELWFE
jgi:hypothetical protein